MYNVNFFQTLSLFFSFSLILSSCDSSKTNNKKKIIKNKNKNKNSKYKDTKHCKNPLIFT
uniref:Lipoprotein n=1 Tax=Octopus bimaculoides TaxID=37653 RepID=A0A0L8FSA0_OCTBM